MKYLSIILLSILISCSSKNDDPKPAAATTPTTTVVNGTDFKLPADGSRNVTLYFVTGNMKSTFRYTYCINGVDTVRKDTKDIQGITLNLKKGDSLYAKNELTNSTYTGVGIEINLNDDKSHLSPNFYKESSNTVKVITTTVVIP